MTNRFIRFITIFGIVLLILSGCSKEVTSDQKTVKDYVETMGYKVTSDNGEVYQYKIENETMEDTLNQQIWGVQKVEPDKYFGKEISMYGFTVLNHPLGELYSLNTTVSVMTCEGKVIGGTSLFESTSPIQNYFYPLGFIYASYQQRKCFNSIKQILSAFR